VDVCEDNHPCIWSGVPLISQWRVHQKIMAMNDARGWPCMLENIDCMHWRWKNCPKAWHGFYCGKSRDPTIVLEAIASHDLWIWHCFFGLLGSLSDISVLHRSHLFAKLANGEAPACN
jgi:hypothetical protein